jgi:hypothetical protein
LVADPGLSNFPTSPTRRPSGSGLYTERTGFAAARCWRVCVAAPGSRCSAALAA